MIINKILDRYDGDAYDPKDFYDAMMSYEEGTDFSISRALDSGEEEDIKRELCAYIDDGYYNPKIKDFINSVKWLEADDGKDYSKEFDILGESKKGESNFKCSMKKKKENLAKKNERLFTLYDIHGNYPNFFKTAPWRTSQFWKEYEDYYSKAYPTMGIKITMTGDDSVDVTSNGKFIMNYSWKNGRHRATAEDGSGFKHPGFGFRDDLSMIYRGLTGKEMGPYVPVYTDESKKKESKKHTCSMQKKKESLAKKSEADSGAMTWTVTVEFDDNGKSVRKDYVVKAHNRESAIDQAKLKPQHTNPDAKNIKVTYCKLGESLVKKHTCSMQKKKESLAKKCEEYIPNVRERLWSFIDAGFITTEEIGDYLLRSLSVDTIEKVYGWLVQDEMIPSEETLADEHQLKFGDDGELVSTETDDSTESKKS